MWYRAVWCGAGSMQSTGWRYAAAHICYARGHNNHIRWLGSIGAVAVAVYGHTESKSQ